MTSQDPKPSLFIAQVVIDTPLNRHFDYLIPSSMVPTLRIGSRVRVPFGRRSCIGIVINLSDQSDVSSNKLKAIEQCIDEKALIPSSMIQWCQWASRYYHHPIGQVILGQQLKAIRQGESLAIPSETIYQATPKQSIDSISRAPKQRALLQAIEASSGMTQTAIAQSGFSSSILQALLEKQQVQAYAFCPLESGIGDKVKQAFLTPNMEQLQAINILKTDDCFGVSVLQGVTGSGKTEVYFHWMQHLLNQNKQVLLLIPEINLSPQSISRIQARFNTPIACLHSGLSDKARMTEWKKAYHGHARLIVGTRSAIFCILPHLGAIIIDEEHDLSFKQQEGFRYHARDLAIVRAKHENIPILLGSATPSMESFYNGMQKKYQWMTLSKRAGSACMPSIHVIDIKDQKCRHGLSAPLISALKKHLDQNKQVMLFLNRRGYAPVMFCRECGWKAKCIHCDAQMTVHLNQSMLWCHHCNARKHLPKKCEACGFHEIVHVGVGTQQLQDHLEKDFPNHAIIRIDRDSIQNKLQLDAALNQINQKKADIIIGTQMLAKGHHFSQLSLVAICDVDQALYSADFRATERLGQIITQVAGRAGRETDPGEVILQTRQPNHPVLKALLNHPYQDFIKGLSDDRSCHQLPPFTHWAIIHAKAKQHGHALEQLRMIKQWLEKNTDQSVCLLGPIPAQMEKKAGWYRAHLCLQSKQRPALQKQLAHLQKQGPFPAPNQLLRLSIDVDPMESII